MAPSLSAMRERAFGTCRLADGFRLARRVRLQQIIGLAAPCAAPSPTIGYSRHSFAAAGDRCREAESQRIEPPRQNAGRAATIFLGGLFALAVLAAFYPRPRLFCRSCWPLC